MNKEKISAEEMNQRVNDALKMVKLEGYENRFSNQLSGGQRQRLSLARAIIRKPDLLFLGEATSSLDTESEKLIQQSISNLAGEITIVVIAHRLSTIHNANYIYVLEKGKIIEEGTYDKLSKQGNSKLAKMIKSQEI